MPEIKTPEINQNILPDIKTPEINKDAFQRVTKKPAPPAAIDLSVNDKGSILPVLEKNLLDISLAASVP